jgi:hypothetical protein
MVPGARTYSDVTRDGPTTVVFSTSITKGLKQEHFDEKVNGQVIFRRFHGHKARHIKEYVWTHLEELTPASAIIQMGGNDLPTPRHNPVPVIDIANHIIETGVICRNYGVQKVCIGGVISRRQHYMQQRCRDLNALLVNMCKIHGFIFLDNSDIESRDLYDGVHLNDQGNGKLFENYLFGLNGDIIVT